jgi:hypothetical protein
LPFESRRRLGPRRMPSAPPAYRRDCWRKVQPQSGFG